MKLIFEGKAKKQKESVETLLIYSFEENEEYKMFEELSFEEKLQELCLHEENESEKKELKHGFRRYDLKIWGDFIIVFEKSTLFCNEK